MNKQRKEGFISLFLGCLLLGSLAAYFVGIKVVVAGIFISTMTIGGIFLIVNGIIRLLE